MRLRSTRARRNSMAASSRGSIASSSVSSSTGIASVSTTRARTSGRSATRSCDRRARAEIRWRHHHAARLRRLRYRRQQELRAFLRRGRGHLAEALRDLAIDARAPKFDGGIITRLDCVVFGIVVNRNCERFYDEGEDIWPKRYAIWGRLVAAQPDQIAYIVFDASSLKLFMPSCFPPIEAQSIGELAGKLELNADALEKTIATFNAAVRPGTFDDKILDDCRTEGISTPKSHWARRIETPPFYAYPVRPGITFTYLGTGVNRDARMLMKDGKPAGNMFAAGEI